MLSFIKFLNYLNNNPDFLSDEQIINLHKLLFCQTNDIFVDSKKISSILNVKISFGTKILINLQKYLGLALTIRCPECGMDQIYSNSKYYEHCNYQLFPTDNNISTKIEGLLSVEKKIKDNEETVRNERLDQIMSIWEKQKFLIYILIDVSNSESIQNESDTNYSKYLESLRTIIKYEAMPCVRGEYLYLGEIGDCFKIALSDTTDILPFINKLAETHYSFFKAGKYPKAVEGLDPYPCIKVSAQLIELTTSKNPKDLLCKTLNGSLDFNYSLLTKLFRLDGNIKLNYKTVFSNDNKMCTWIFDKLATKIGLEAKTQHITAFKHKDFKSEADVIAFTYPGGKPVLSESPESFLVPSDKDTFSWIKEMVQQYLNGKKE